MDVPAWPDSVTDFAYSLLNFSSLSMIAGPLAETEAGRGGGQPGEVERPDNSGGIRATTQGKLLAAFSCNVENDADRFCEHQLMSGVTPSE